MHSLHVAPHFSWYYPFIFCPTSIIYPFAPTTASPPAPPFWPLNAHFPPFSIRLLNLAFHSSSFYTLPLHIFPTLHPFHSCFITPFFFSLPNWNLIPLSSGDKPCNLIPTLHILYVHSLPLNLFSLSFTPSPLLNTILHQSRCTRRPIRQRSYRAAPLFSAWRSAYWYNLVIRWRNNGLYPGTTQGSKTIGSLGLSVRVCICTHSLLCTYTCLSVWSY